MNLPFSDNEPSYEDGRTLLNGNTLDSDNKLIEGKLTTTGELLLNPSKNEIEEEKKGEREFQFGGNAEAEEDQQF